MKVARNEKRKNLRRFSYYTNIANFEAFFWNLNLSTNRLFWRCEYSRIDSSRHILWDFFFYNLRILHVSLYNLGEFAIRIIKHLQYLIYVVFPHFLDHCELLNSELTLVIMVINLYTIWNLLGCYVKVFQCWKLFSFVQAAESQTKCLNLCLLKTFFRKVFLGKYK